MVSFRCGVGLLCLSLAFEPKGEVSFHVILGYKRWCLDTSFIILLCVYVCVCLFFNIFIVVVAVFFFFGSNNVSFNLNNLQ
ncbi:hypothetical protein RchiOBHm_Chr4g0398901 [Rosa chinensis]|uniref:Uncharacterized protein n=1 Tax=Rosa chinensis TaxID=74649 RepID=A0A2P6QSE6_ROSCH|nr:hypothetical protein RchiOBHm_Chr4g0398901 [Rosa chinensis]